MSDLSVARVLLALPPEAYRAMPVYDALTALGYPAKIVVRRLERMVKEGLLDVGVSIRMPWLTPIGLARRQALSEPWMADG